MNGTVRWPLNEAMVAKSFPSERAAGELGMTEGGAKMTVTRMRQRYRQLLRGKVAQTVTHPGEIDEELRHLRRLIAR
jgi:hypothetical protein